jgi:hypothetical protein
MDHKIIKFGETEKNIVQFDGQDIEVTPFISGSLEAFLIDQYIQDYFYSDTDKKILPSLSRNYLGAELHLKLTILDRLTDIQISNADDSDYTDKVCTELWGLVVNEIKNFWDFEESLSSILDEIKNELDLEKSVGGVISGVASKINELLDKLNQFSPDEMKQMTSEATKVLKELETSSASQVFVEAGRNKASKVQ